MRKLFTLAVLLLSTIAATSQTSGRNLFDEADIDENGWLWFDTAEKIEKYIGVIDETNYKVDPTGKLIQMVYADIMPDYPASEASEEFVGAGTDGEIGTEGSRTGAIMLQPASAGGTVNGGGFVVCMPSCYSYAICFSSNSRVMTRLVATTNAAAPMNNCLAECTLDSDNAWRVISATYASIFKRFPVGINTWEGLETLNNGYEPIVTLQSENPINVWFQSSTKDTIYIHGIKAITQETEIVEDKDTTDVDNGIFNLNVLECDQQTIYTIDGKKVGNNVSGLNRGLYIVTEQGKARKVVK